MPKLNFKDYLDNYEEIKTEEKNTEKINDLKYQKELAEEVNQEYLVLKEYLEILKRSINNSSMSKTDIEKNINNNIGNITLLRVKTYTLCKKSKIFSDGFDTLKGTIGNLCMLLAILIGAIISEHFIIAPGSRLIYQIFTVLGILISDRFLRRTIGKLPIFSSGFKALIGLLPFNNRYSFVKNLRKLNKLEKEYEMLGKQYKEYLKYLDSTEKSEVTENIIKDKEVKDLYLLEINKLVDKVKELPLGSDRDKYLDTIEKLTELYKREKERIILKNGRVHSEEESEFEMSILKQIAYIEMELNNSLYKTRSTQLLSEDYLTTLNKLDSTKDKKLERTLGIGK